MFDSGRSTTLTRLSCFMQRCMRHSGRFPFLPAFTARGCRPSSWDRAQRRHRRAIAGSATPGRIGDLIQRSRSCSSSVALAASVTWVYLVGHGLWLLGMNLLHAASLAPITILADALALQDRLSAAAAVAGGLWYGWVRGTGSAAFMSALLSGQAVGAFGLDLIVWLQALLLAVAAFVAILVPELIHPRTADAVRAPAGGVLILFRLPVFRNLVLVAALILGSHAMHDAFAVIRWSAAGISPGTASLLWSESVAAEVLVFFVIGPALVTRLTPAGAAAIAALAGILRWTVMAQTTDVMALALVQPLHGITFALLHLACMRLIARTVPHGLEGTAQAIYGTVGIGTATALLILVSGVLYARLGAQGFWVMATLCALAFPLTWKLRQPVSAEVAG